jgi:Serine carboxypeptidase
MPSDAGRTPDSAQDASNTTIAAEAGFSQIEPVDFVLDGTSYVSEPGRLWYAFEPALGDPAHAPLFVFFNGGPGSSTTEYLFAGNTAGQTEDPNFTGGAAIAPSPRPWTALGNLLYIDARQTGFSYDVNKDADDAGARRAGYSNANFSSAFDAADFVRVVLRFLTAHAALAGSAVVLVGESYGGVRAAAMLHDLLHSETLRTSVSAYVDTALADEIDQHFTAIFPDLTGPASPTTAARQFGRQILIEPVVAGRAQFEAAGQLLNQAGSPLYVLGKQIGKPYVPCDCDAACGTGNDCQRAYVVDAGRDPHDIDVTLAAQAAHQAAVEASLSTPAVLASALGVALDGIPLLRASERSGAYRAVSLAHLPWTPSDESALRSTLGQPAPWDWYLLGENPGVAGLTRMGKDLMLPDWGADFLADLPYVKTFITHAMLDVVVYPPSIPASLAKAFPTLVSSVAVDSAPRKGVARPGWFTVHYAASAADGSAPIGPQTVRFPVYATSGHHVSSAQPVALEEDVATWMAEP